MYKFKFLFNNSLSGVAYISWNPDSTHLLVCGPEESPEVLLWNVENENFLKVTQSPEDALTCCAWNKDGTRFVVRMNYTLLKTTMFQNIVELKILRVFTLTNEL